MDFNQSFEVLLGNEGDFTDDPKDRGNWTSGRVGEGVLKGTKYGISAMTYPSLDIRNLTVGKAKEIYYKDFWSKVHCEELPEAIRFDIFDVAVNSGCSTAIKLLQRAINVTDDGIIGKVTLKALSEMDAQLLDKRLSAQRLLFISALKTFPIYGKGWIVRVANNLMKD
jgi:lysozyme family protein